MLKSPRPLLAVLLTTASASAAGSSMLRTLIGMIARYLLAAVGCATVKEDEQVARIPVRRDVALQCSGDAS